MKLLALVLILASVTPVFAQTQDQPKAPTTTTEAPVVVHDAAWRVHVAKMLEEAGLRAGNSITVIASGPDKTYITIYTGQVSKAMFFQTGEDQETLDRFRRSGFKRLTISDPSLRNYTPMKGMIGDFLLGNGNGNHPGCDVPDECTHTWNF
jgi:hypothetical protein